MEVVKLIQPHEFGDSFIFEGGKWKVRFPPAVVSGVEVSKDANNLITLGGDGGMFADATLIHAYALVQDNENMKIHLYQYQSGLEFDLATATLVNSIDMVELNGQFDDITITDAVVTFKDVQTDTELVFDTAQFQNVSGLTSDDTISLSAPNGEVEGVVVETTTKQAAARLRDYSNLIQETPEGLLVIAPTGDAIKHSLELRSYQMDVPNEEPVEANEFIRTINGNKLHIPATVLKNVRGTTLGAIVTKLTDKLPIPTADKVTILSDTSILDSQVKIDGEFVGNFSDLAQNQIPQLQFILINGEGGYDDGYSSGGYDDGYGEVSGYSFILRNNTTKRLRVTIEGFNTTGLSISTEGISNIVSTSNKVSFDLIGRYVDEVTLHLAYVDEDDVTLDMSELDTLHDGGSTVKLIATYLNYDVYAPAIEVTVNGETQTLTTDEFSREAVYTVTLPEIDDQFNQYYWPEVKVVAVTGTPVNAPISPYPIAVRSMMSMPDITVTSGGVVTPYACDESAWNGTFNYVYRPTEEYNKAIMSSGRSFSITTHPRLANMLVVYDSDDVLPGEDYIGRLDDSGSIDFTTKELIPRTDDGGVISILDEDIHANYYINIAVDRV